MLDDRSPPASHTCSCRAVRPVIDATSRELYVFFRRITLRGKSIRRGGSREVLVGQAAFAVRGIGERDALVVDQDVGMMIRLLGLWREAVHECDRRREVLERVLFLDRVALERPALQRLHPLFRVSS